MFNLQGSEIVIVLLLALVVLGPEKLPDAMRKLGAFYAELKKMSSGFQSEFRAAIDEPMREVRDTANVLRDSADLTKLQDGEREEKPKSAEMGPVNGPAAEPSESVTDVDGPASEQSPDEPELAVDSKPAPFSGHSSAAPRSVPDTVDAGDPSGPPSEPTEDAPVEPVAAVDAKPAPFSGRSSAAPRSVPDTLDAGDASMPAEFPGPESAAASVPEVGTVVDEAETGLADHGGEPDAAVGHDEVVEGSVADDDAAGRAR